MEEIYCELDSNGNVRNNSHLDQQIYNKYGSMIKEMEEMKDCEATYHCGFNKEHKKARLLVTLQSNELCNITVFARCDCNKEYTLTIKEYDCKSQNNVTEARGFKNAQELVDYLLETKVELVRRKKIADCFTCKDDICFINYKIKIKED